MIAVFRISKLRGFHFEVNKAVNARDSDPTKKGRSNLCKGKFFDQVH